MSNAKYLTPNGGLEHVVPTGFSAGAATDSCCFGFDVSRRTLHSSLDWACAIQAILARNKQCLM
jgi:hypothetical protein